MNVRITYCVALLEFIVMLFTKKNLNDKNISPFLLISLCVHISVTKKWPIRVNSAFNIVLPHDWIG